MRRLHYVCVRSRDLAGYQIRTRGNDWEVEVKRQNEENIHKRLTYANSLLHIHPYGSVQVKPLRWQIPLSWSAWRAGLVHDAEKRCCYPTAVSRLF
jgi:uridine kinase